MPVNRVNDACYRGITGISMTLGRHLQQHKQASQQPREKIGTTLRRHYNK
jgi:hypothetical protein